jgi:uncharacterized protein (TIGR02147 family)
MVNIFDFIDFREYLNKYYDDKKGGNPHFSYQLLAQKAGFSNRGFLYNIVKGNKSLSKIHCLKLSQALGHTKKEAEYFENIVFYGQAPTDEQRDHFLEQAIQCKGKTVTQSHLLRKDQYEYFSKWYHSAIRALIDAYDFEGDYAKLSQKLSPPITPMQAKKAVKLLERLNLITRKENGIYYITEKSIKASSEISQSAKNRFYLEYNKLAKNTITNHPPESREISSLTLGISANTYNIICKEIRQFKERIIELANNDDNADRVYQYQQVFFPLTNNDTNQGA